MGSASEPAAVTASVAAVEPLGRPADHGDPGADTGEGSARANPDASRPAGDDRDAPFQPEQSELIHPVNPFRF